MTNTLWPNSARLVVELVIYTTD